MSKSDRAIFILFQMLVIMAVVSCFVWLRAEIQYRDTHISNLNSEVSRLKDELASQKEWIVSLEGSKQEKPSRYVLIKKALETYSNEQRRRMALGLPELQPSKETLASFGYPFEAEIPAWESLRVGE